MPTAQDAPAVAALEPWYGSKRTLAPKIVEAIGPHRAYFEPFCGSMAVLLGKPRCAMETVNDLHGDLINLARVIRSPELGPKLFRHLRRVWFSEELWRETADVFRAPELDAVPPKLIDFDRAAAFAIFGWFGRNGVVGSDGGVNFCVRYTSNGGSPSKRWDSWVKSIPWFHKRLQGVTILRQDGFAILERIEDKAGTVIYCDPPYIAKGAKYIHDFEEADHQRLADLLARFQKTRVVVSYYQHPDLARIYPGWSILEVPTTKAMVQSGRRDKAGRTEAPEVLLVNGRAPGEPAYKCEAGKKRLGKAKKVKQPGPIICRPVGDLPLRDVDSFPALLASKLEAAGVKTLSDFEKQLDQDTFGVTMGEADFPRAIYQTIVRLAGGEGYNATAARNAIMKQIRPGWTPRREAEGAAP